jgi:hypothetical protein
MDKRAIRVALQNLSCALDQSVGDFAVEDRPETRNEVSKSFRYFSALWNKLEDIEADEF